ncbi:MAG: hypothetical protein U0324_43990 [Polyangiales bacterium]
MAPQNHQVFAGDPAFWATDRNERVAAYLRGAGEAVEKARAVVEGVAEAAIVTGEVAQLREALRLAPRLAWALDGLAATGQPHATLGVALPDLLVALCACGRLRCAACVMAEHKRGGEGVVLLVLLAGAWACLRLVTVEDDAADVLPVGSVAKGGDA